MKKLYMFAAMLMAAVLVFSVGYKIGSTNQKRSDCVQRFVDATDGRDIYTVKTTTPICKKSYPLF